MVEHTGMAWWVKSVVLSHCHDFYVLTFTDAHILEKRNSVKHCSLAGERVDTPVKSKHTLTILKNREHSRTDPNGLAILCLGAFVHFAMHTFVESTDGPTTE